MRSAGVIKKRRVSSPFREAYSSFSAHYFTAYTILITDLSNPVERRWRVRLQLLCGQQDKEGSKAKRAFQYAVYELLWPKHQVQALLKSPSPLADVFAAWEDRETSYMEEIWQTVTGRAKEETQKFRNAQKER